jgi:hypothetical protein
MNLPAFNQLVYGFRSERIANGALGAGVDIDVPINEIWSPISIYATLATSVIAGDRMIGLQIGRTAYQGFRFVDDHAIAASSDRAINFFQGAHPVTPALGWATWQFPIPIDSFVEYPNHISLLIYNADANDQWQNIYINFRVWSSQ